MEQAQTDKPNPTAGLAIIYDGDCPVCSAYVRMARLRASAGPVRLIDARGEDPLVGEARARGFDLNDGMVVQFGGRMYYGAEAMTLLSALSTGSGLFNRLAGWAFRDPARARRLYPVLVRGRLLLLRLLGRRPIEGQPDTAP